MPVIIIGADTPVGEQILEILLPRDGEVRAFVTDPHVGMQLKERSVKVAIGDVSDGSHVGGAATRAFCAIAITDAAVDDRERSFATNPSAVYAAWADGLSDAGVTRIIVVENGHGSTDPLIDAAPETVRVSTNDPNLAERVGELEAMQALA